MRKYLITFMLLPLFLLAIGCTPKYEEPVDGYTTSSIHGDFPIPESSALLETISSSENPNIDNGVKYEVKGIGGEQGLSTPERYIQEIQDSGWTELKDNRLGHVYFFKKEDTVISLEIRQDSITLYEMTKDAII
ncbi:hypothetical protein C7121_16535 [Paenibacillus glucanolyticus]|jgi:hypothetical protein|uniref:Lipoprotein n=2 Tax=Paenibacillus glucanolyticus TaxID=59843 RepID=A0A163ELQ7_9BACL|nr:MULTISPECIES: hypothetical protein [Paenibacillus]ANA78475.1 hypothetical protein A3958_00020 [Paenibacillus glucanolyticus]AVV57610.1 hypothetical protein C7121_16535 [Paenibacillus glucanolyticus]AWP26769.1 hypothetical protein B9D94_09135 [Paenibacillus sp. Cedars]ETT34379.1 hypothetical protein C169_18514 [Paenibacillus sp. FSL R5-808]KZS43872.1 hypothetical protein AWU65_27715 [Paenibacillus glucanolyticus]